MSTRNTALALAVLAVLSACALEPAPTMGGHPSPGSGRDADRSPVATFGDPRALVTEAMATPDPGLLRRAWVASGRSPIRRSGFNLLAQMGVTREAQRRRWH
jgi:hypothetical protein